MRKTRILICDDQPLIRSSLALILGTEEDFEVVGTAADGREAVTLALELTPDVVLMDIQMPVLDGVGATAQITSVSTAKVVVLTTFDRDDYLFAAIDAGASGFLLKNTEPEMIISAVHAAADGQALLSPEVTLRIIQRGTVAAQSSVAQPASGSITAGDQRILDELTAREREVLIALASGKSNVEIAGTLFVSEATVKTHLSNILSKAGLRDRVQAVVFAYRVGLIPSTEV
ncbi:response regulator [Paeniglutamicibacter terrestris]|uniref:Response regulator transcription factor n=1 Tax=Paeniglutamicibacter terrestris TaxID=2723403 RepID=A0ABX1FZU4_9MICC|nr:response regulator transcription factor [Paeniglutamicibacter terrestris]NKG19465.1 response regulator transcription factor [Paeniglutamicibacter terrestris]